MATDLFCQTKNWHWESVKALALMSPFFKTNYFLLLSCQISNWRSKMKVSHFNYLPYKFMSLKKPVQIQVKRLYLQLKLLVIRSVIKVSNCGLDLPEVGTKQFNSSHKSLPQKNLERRGWTQTFDINWKSLSIGQNSW